MKGGRIVFNEFYCKPDGTLEPLKTPGVDTGMGLERLAVASQGKQHIFETDLFTPILDALPDELDERIKRVIADHARSIVFLISDGVRPSNKEQGYVLRRLIRRVMTHEYLYDILEKDQFDVQNSLKAVVQAYRDFYGNLDEEIVLDVFREEYTKFSKSAVELNKQMVYCLK